MMRLYVSNSFALSMLDKERIKDRPRTPIYLGGVEEARQRIADWEFYGASVISCIGHADTAELFTRLLGRNLPFNRISVKLDDQSCILVGQYSGPRLTEGATELPEGAEIEWWII